MADIAVVHPELLQFCNGQPGVAMGVELFNYVMKNAVSSVNIGTSGGPIRFPGSLPWNNFPVAFLMSIDAANMAVVFDLLIGPAGEPAVPRVSISNLRARFGIVVGGTYFCSHTVDYALIRAFVNIAGQKLNLTQETIQGDYSVLPADIDEPWRKMANLPDGSPFTPDLQKQWEVQQEAYKLIAFQAIGSAFIDAVVIPNILRMIKSFDFTGPIKLVGTKEIVILTGTAEWKFGCPNRPADLHLSKQTDTVLRSNLEESSGSIPAFDYQLPPGSPDASYPIRDGQETERVGFGDIFIHLPQLFMSHRFDGIVKPSVTFSDEGTIAIIHWHYEASISPAPGSVLTISLVTLWPTEFQVSIPLLIYGDAGAGVKIACIETDVAGVGFRDIVDPFSANFRIGLDTSTAELYFESYLSAAHSQGATFNHFPPAGFPIDQIADFILGKIADTVVDSVSGTILNVSRFSVADFDLFAGFGKMLPQLAAASDKVATTYGVNFEKK